MPLPPSLNHVLQLPAVSGAAVRRVLHPGRRPRRVDGGDSLLHAVPAQPQGRPALRLRVRQRVRARGVGNWGEVSGCRRAGSGRMKRRRAAAGGEQQVPSSRGHAARPAPCAPRHRSCPGGLFLAREQRWGFYDLSANITFAGPGPGGRGQVRARMGQRQGRRRWERLRPLDPPCWHRPDRALPTRPLRGCPPPPPPLNPKGPGALGAVAVPLPPRGRAPRGAARPCRPRVVGGQPPSVAAAGARRRGLRVHRRGARHLHAPGLGRGL
jgi:hypothetical protein